MSSICCPTRFKNGHVDMDNRFGTWVQNYWQSYLQKPYSPLSVAKKYFVWKSNLLNLSVFKTKYVKGAG